MSLSSGQAPVLLLSTQVVVPLSSGRAPVPVIRSSWCPMANYVGFEHKLLLTLKFSPFVMGRHGDGAECS